MTSPFLGFFRRCRHTLPAHAQVAIVGAGPAGLYCATNLLKSWNNGKIDVYERLPLPYGLIRYGVAPDHPEVKNCINQFQETFNRAESSARFEYFGNVNVGRDVSVRELVHAYHIVVLAYGAAHERALDLPGTPPSRRNVLSAREFVAWYNGEPDAAERFGKRIALADVETAVVVGHGNVALDCARMLLRARAGDLAETDIPEYALKELCAARKLKRVILVGRRGPLQVAFTTAELREMFELKGFRTQLDRDDFSVLLANPSAVEKLARPRRRLTQLILDRLSITRDSDLEWSLKFRRTPMSIDTVNDQLQAIELRKNTLSDELDVDAKAQPSDAVERIDCELLITSIGQASENINDSSSFVPWSTRESCVIVDANGQCLDRRGLYAVGWCARSPPTGVLATTQMGARSVGHAIVEAVKTGVVDVREEREGREGIVPLLRERKVKVLTWADWAKVDGVERSRGKTKGKRIEKLTEMGEIMRVIGEEY